MGKPAARRETDDRLVLVAAAVLLLALDHEADGRALEAVEQGRFERGVGPRDVGPEDDLGGCGRSAGVGLRRSGC